MGIHGIYKEIGPGRRVALSKFAVERYLKHSRPLRLAIDISIWLFQIQSGKGGSNPALRTFYYRLLRLLSLNIHPLFVFDGPNKPPFKRNKRVGGPNVKVSSIPEFLAKQLLKQFGFPIHLAPGEAEAECALLQREGIVDAVLSEDVDTLMFGSGVTMRSWSPEMKSSKVPTHVNVYDAHVTKEGSGLDREGMILIALMSGGDYIPEGIPGCGPKTACEAARAGFGADLCKLKKKDDLGFRVWRERLQHELWTNESKLFKQRRRLDIPEDFPNREVLGYYTHPCVSSQEKLANLRQSLRWDIPIDFPSLRSFTADAFDWVCLGGAKKFIRNLAPAILTRELRLRAESGANDGGDIEIQNAAEDRLVTAIHGRRNHASTDNMPEIRISFLPMNIVNIDLSQEPPDEEVQQGFNDEEDSDAPVTDDVEVESSCPPSPRKRGPSKYNPEELEKIWMMDVFLRHGVPLKVQDWEASYRDPKQYLAAKRAARDATKKKKTTGGMPRGALDPFTRVIKLGATRPDSAKSSSNHIDSVDLSDIPSSAPARVDSFRMPSQPMQRTSFRRPVLDEVNLSDLNSSRHPPQSSSNTLKRPSPEPISPARHSRSKSETPQASRMKQPTIIDLLSSPIQARERTPTAQASSGRQPFSSNGDQPEPGELPALPDTVTKRRRRSPFKRHETAPAALLDLVPSSALVTEADLDLSLGTRVEEVDLSLSGLQGSPIHRPASRPVHPPMSEGTRLARLQQNLPAEDRGHDQHSATVSTHLHEITGDHDIPASSRILTSSVMQAFARPSDKVPSKTKIRKKHYQIRESLEGAWKEIHVDVEVDLTSPRASRGLMGKFVTGGTGETSDDSTMSRQGDGKAKTRWRQSEVEFLDLTET